MSQQQATASSNNQKPQQIQQMTSTNSGQKVLVRQTKVINQQQHQQNQNQTQHSSPNPIQRLQGSSSTSAGGYHSTKQYNIHALQATQPNAASFVSNQQSSMLLKQQQSLLNSKTTSESIIATKDDFRKSMQAKVTLNLAKQSVMQSKLAGQQSHLQSQQILSVAQQPDLQSQITACQGAAQALKKKLVKLRTTNKDRLQSNQLHQLEQDSSNQQEENKRRTPATVTSNKQEGNPGEVWDIAEDVPLFASTTSAATDYATTVGGALEGKGKRRVQHQRGSCKSQIASPPQLNIEKDEQSSIKDDNGMHVVNGFNGNKFKSQKANGVALSEKDQFLNKDEHNQWQQSVQNASEKDKSDNSTQQDKTNKVSRGKRSSLLTSSANMPLSAAFDHQFESRAVQNQLLNLQGAAQTFQTPIENTIVPKLSTHSHQVQLELKSNNTATIAKKHKGTSQGMIKISQQMKQQHQQQLIQQQEASASSITPNLTSAKSFPSQKNSIKSVTQSAKQFKTMVSQTPAAEKSAAEQHFCKLIQSPEITTTSTAKFNSGNSNQVLLVDEKFLNQHRATIQPRTSKGSKLNSPLRSPESFQLKTNMGFGETNDILASKVNNLPPPASAHSKATSKKGGKNGGSVVTTPAFKTGFKELMHQKRGSMGTILPTRQQQVGISPMRGSFEEMSNAINNQLLFQPQQQQQQQQQMIKKSGVPTVPTQPNSNQGQLIITTPQPASKKAGTQHHTYTTVTTIGSRKHSTKHPSMVMQHADLHAYTDTASVTAKPSGNRSRKNSQTALAQGGPVIQQPATTVISLTSQAENLYQMHEKLAKLQQQSNQGFGNTKASKADRGAHYHIEKQKKSKKAQLHESGQFSPTTSKLIKHFLSKQKTKEALIATLSGDNQKSVPRKQTNLIKDSKKTTDIHKKHPIYAQSATQSQRSLKHGQRRQSVPSSNKLKDSQPSTQMHRSSMIPTANNNGIGKEICAAIISKKLSIGSRKNSSNKHQHNNKIENYNLHQLQQAQLRNSMAGSQQVISIAHSGSSKKLLEKVKPPLQQKNSQFTGVQNSPRQHNHQGMTKFVLRQSKKRDSQSSVVDAQSLDKRMSLSQSVQQLPQNSGTAAPSEKRLVVKKIKQQSKQDKEINLLQQQQQNQLQQNEVLRSIEKLQLQRSRKGPNAKSIQVSGSDSSSVLQTIVSINRHPYFVGETFSDKNVNTEQPSMTNVNTQQNQFSNSTKNDLMVNSETNALAVTSDQTKTKRKIKQTSQTSHKNGQASSSKKGQKNNKSVHMTQDQVMVSNYAEQRVHNFEPYGQAPVSPIGQSLFDNINSNCLTGNHTNLFSGRSSGDKLRDIITKMQEELAQKPETSKEALQQLEAMHDIIQNQEGLIKQFQKDIQRQEEVISRYEKHIRQLEGSNKTGAGQSSNVNNNFVENNISGFTERDSSSLLNPSSHCNNLAFKRQGTELLSPNQKKIFSPCETDREGTVKYNLTEKSTPGRKQLHQIQKYQLQKASGQEIAEGVDNHKDAMVIKYATSQPPTSTDKQQLVSSVPDESESFCQTHQQSQQNINKASKILTDRKLCLMEEKEHMRLKLRKKEKQERFMKQKINKLMFFFFTLQNKGVPVNEIYEQEGIKAIRTDRFDEIMAQIAKENNCGEQQPVDGEKRTTAEGGEEDEEYSFYTEDSYELLMKNPDIKMQSYQRPKNVPALNLQGLPDYVSSSEEEEYEEDIPQNSAPNIKEESKTGNIDDEALQQQRQSMSQKDYRQSLQYIEKFYQKHQMAQSEEVTIGSIDHGNPRENQDQNPFSTPELIITNEDLKEPDECSVPIPSKKKRKDVKAENPDQWNPLSTPQKGGGVSDNEVVPSVVILSQSRCLDRCPSQVNKPETGLEILDQVTGLGVAMKSNKDVSSRKDQHSERNHSSLQLSSLLSPPSTKKHGHQQSQSMINNKADKFSSSSHPYQASQNPASSKRMQKSLASQSQSQLESIDMVLSHDPCAKDNLGVPTNQQQTISSIQLSQKVLSNNNK